MDYENAPKETMNGEDEKFSSNISDNHRDSLVPPERRPSLRRNSISLPNLDDFVLEIEPPRTDKVSENEFCYNSDFSDVEDYVQNQNDSSNKEGQRVPLRSGSRRKSITVMPSRIILNSKQEDEESGSNSPVNSITSINSLASLLREKMQSLPKTIRDHKPKDYKIRTFVAFLFLTIIFLVAFAYVLYRQKVLQRAYFERIKFSKADKVMKIFNADGLEIVRGKLGTTINYDSVHPCLPQDDPHDGSICLEWMQRARLYMRLNKLQDSDIRCYNLHWFALAEHIEPTDCIDMSNGHWYGGGQNMQSAWPLEKAHFEFGPFVTGRINKHLWGNVLKGYFINSKGVAIFVDEKSPLHVSIRREDGERKELCLKAKYDDFAYVNRINANYAQLNYSICTGTEMNKLHLYLSEKSLWDGLKEEDINVIHSLLTEPLWQITSASKEDFDEGTVFNYTDDVIALGFLKQGHVLINEFWQREIGDFTVDTEKFPTLEETMNILHRRGFRVAFSIQPFISTESTNFAKCVKDRLLISERFSDRRIPALTRYKTLESAGLLDVTNNSTMPWLLEKLKKVMAKYQFDAFYLDLGVAYNMPHYYHCEKKLRNPDQYKTIIINSLQGNINIFGVNSAVERPRAPIFVSLPMAESSWNGLRQVIPTILTYGIIGYPFVIPGAVGGDFGGPKIDKASNATETNILLPDKELYIRWLQLATFLPVIRFTHLPSTYGDEKLLETAKILTLLRQQTVTPLLKKYAGDSLDSGLPLIRPLWMLEVNDQAIVTDEFSIGQELIVAPILKFGARQREVYLPAGVWKDGIDGSLRKGSRWIHDYRVEVDQIAYFERMPDNTRF